MPSIGLKIEDKVGNLKSFLEARSSQRKGLRQVIEILQLLSDIEALFLNGDVGELLEAKIDTQPRTDGPTLELLMIPPFNPQYRTDHIGLVLDQSNKRLIALFHANCRSASTYLAACEEFKFLVRTEAEKLV